MDDVTIERHHGCVISRGILLVLLLAALAAVARAADDTALRRAPRIVDVNGSTLPQAELLATPDVRTLLGYTRRILHLPDNHTLAVFSYSSSGAKANWLFLIDARDLSSQRFDIPNNDVASHGAALGADGNIYIMPYRTGRAYKFDTKAKTFAEIHVDFPPGDYTWDAIGSSDGCIYFGTYPSASVGRYEIATGKTTLWIHPIPNTTYVSNFSLDDTAVRCKAWGPDQIWLHVDAAGKVPVRVDAPAPTTLPTQAIKNGEPCWTEPLADGSTITIGHYGSLSRGQHRSRVDNLAPGGNAIMFIESVTPDCVIGGNYSQQHLFRVNPNTGEVIISEEMIARTTGEPMCAIGLNGKAYIGIYIQSILSVYDPSKPFASKTNPREIGEMFRQHHQTRPSAAVTDGKMVYISSEGDYNTLGGALAVIDPQTEKVDVYPQLVPDQDLTSLAYDAKRNLLWIGTNRWGQQRSHPPTQSSAVIAAFDPKTRKLLTTLTPWTSADDTTAIGCSDGILVVSSGTELALIDTASHEILYKGPSPVPLPRRLVTSQGDKNFFLGSGTLYQWNIPENSLTPRAQAPSACRYITQSSPGLWLLADERSIYRVRLP